MHIYAYTAATKRPAVIFTSPPPPVRESAPETHSSRRRRGGHLAADTSMLANSMECDILVSAWIMFVALYSCHASSPAQLFMCFTDTYGLCPPLDSSMLFGVGL